MLAWIPPYIGVLKLNVDGSRKGSTGSIGAGGVIRDHAGHWIAGYSANLGQRQILEAELWGLFFGLKLAVEKHLNDVIVEMDSATAVMLMHKTEIDSCHPTGGLVRNCKGLMNQIGRIRLNHIYRERNSVADRLAVRSHNMVSGFLTTVLNGWVLCCLMTPQGPLQPA
ncbi:hypothetical protein CerSpe_004980 [Prunus speciosa]